MTKAELIDRIARSRDLPPDLSKKVIGEILDLAFAELGQYFSRTKLTRSNSPRFTYPKFGTFTKKKRSARRGVNPRTLEPMEIEACETIDFKPSAELKRAMNEAASAATKTKRGKPRASRSDSGTSRRASAVEGPGRRKLVTREDAELEPGLAEPSDPMDEQILLPEPPLQRVKGRAARRRRSELDPTG